MRHHLDLPRESKFTDTELWAILRMQMSSGVVGSFRKDCSVGRGNHKIWDLSSGSNPCDPQSGDWVEWVRMGYCAQREGMRPTSVLLGCLPGFLLEHPEKGNLSTFQNLPISLAELSAVTCRADTPATMPTSVHTSAWLHSAAITTS